MPEIPKKNNHDLNRKFFEIDQLRKQINKKRKLSKLEKAVRVGIGLLVPLVLFGLYTPKGLAKKNNSLVNINEKFYAGECSLEVPMLFYSPSIGSFWKRGDVKKYILIEPIPKDKLKDQKWINSLGFMEYCAEMPKPTEKGYKGELKVTYNDRELIQEAVKNYNSQKKQMK